MSGRAITTKDTALKLNRASPMDAIIILCITLLCLTCILPFVHIIAKSLSSYRAVVSNEVSFWPIELTFTNYQRVIDSSIMLPQLWYTIQITFVTTAISLFVTAFAAYPLSKRYLPGRYPITIFFMVTMYFNAGMIPTYVHYHRLGLIDSPWVLILPLAFSAYNMLIMRTFFMNSIPEALEEAAYVDGASHFRIFAQIWCPLSLPVYATIALWVSVQRWNTYGDALWFTTSSALRPLQLYLFQLVRSQQANFDIDPMTVVELNAPEGLQAAAIMFTTIPILLVYPFLQRFFVKGVTLGSVKG
jgi:putative aldouronate transport system permease protein